jgi:cysteine-rich repeat protein
MCRLAIVALALAGCVGSDESTSSQDLSGAVHTTDGSGGIVDGNIYGAKEDVYLDGGPRSNGPALDEGTYMFQVTDPSGKKLLSSDDIACRSFHVSSAGVVDAVLGDACAHATGVDVNGGITIQLVPFADTPNHGGEYKLWVSTDSSFAHKDSKTDNFKVKSHGHHGDDEDNDDEDDDDDNGGGGCGCNTCPPPAPVCGDGHVDAGEECDDGNLLDGDGCDKTCKLETNNCPQHCGP